MDRTTPNVTGKRYRRAVHAGERQPEVSGRATDTVLCRCLKKARLYQNGTVVLYTEEVNVRDHGGAEFHRKNHESGEHRGRECPA